jgi:hypothetical protein
VSFLLFFGVAAVAAASGWLLGRRARATHARALPPAKKAGSAPSVSPLEPFGLDLGDVLVRPGQEDALLVGGLLLSEGSDPVAAILFARAGRGERKIVAAFPGPRTELFWLSVEDVEVARDPPSVLEIRGTMFDRSRRLPIGIQRHGQDLPDLPADALFAEYGNSLGGAAIVLRGTGTALVASGERIARDTVDHLPGNEVRASDDAPGPPPG